MTQIISLPDLAAELLTAAQTSTAGRASRTLPHSPGSTLRQTVLALVAGRALGEHQSPGEATLQVLLGRVILSAGPDDWDAVAGDHLAISPNRHNLAAVEDAAVLLTVVTDTHG